MFLYEDHLLRLKTLALQLTIVFIADESACYFLTFFVYKMSKNMEMSCNFPEPKVIMTEVIND